MTLKEIKEIYKSVFYITEDNILDLIAGTAVATKLPGDPIWTLIIGGPSSGKSELVNILNKVPFVFPISSMSENTFLSNMRLADGQEASLLHQIGREGMITMKDYTSILAMRPEKREILVSQMREIYDGHLTKRSGNGKSEEWKGKINWIGAVTESVYLKEDESAGMGRRTINYVMPDQDRKLTTRRALQNNTDIAEKRDYIQTVFADYIMERVNNLPSQLPSITHELEEKLIELADFVTLARTPTSRDKMRNLVLVPAPEMPMRVFQMFQTLAKVLVYLHGEQLPSIDAILTKLAFDSLTKQRSLILTILAKYQQVTTKGAATELSYPTDTVLEWLQDVNVLKICDRRGGEMGSGPDVWILKDEYRRIMVEYGGIVPASRDLIISGENISTNAPAVWGLPKPDQQDDDPGMIREHEQKIQAEFDAM